jgi:histidinol-phosphate aminotransferase
MKTLDQLIRPHLASLKPYSSARSEHKGLGGILLDANENPFDSPYNRYPDPLQTQLKARIGKLKKVAKANIFVGNGSDEPIDLLYRIFCEPGQDNALCFPPTYGMYEVSAAINNVQLHALPLNEVFDIPLPEALEAIRNLQPKIVWICSPNNPTGKLVPKETILEICQATEGLVVLDEAYIDFSPEQSLLSDLENLPNLVILQTLSKAWGLAGLRLGLAFAASPIVEILNKVKPPYNVNSASQASALEVLARPDFMLQQVAVIKEEARMLAAWLQTQPYVIKVHPSDANFLLVQFADAAQVYASLAAAGILARDRSKVIAGCLRITIGRPEENARLREALQLIHNNSNNS